MTILSRLPSIVAQAMVDAGLFADCTLSRESIASDGRGGFSPSTESVYTAKGLILDYSDFVRASSGSIRQEDRRVILLAEGLEVTPRPSDIVTIDGRDWRAIAVSSDPAKATFELQVRPS
jgi:hypothetical protein